MCYYNENVPKHYDGDNVCAIMFLQTYIKSSAGWKLRWPDSIHAHSHQFTVSMAYISV